MHHTWMITFVLMKCKTFFPVLSIGMPKDPTVRTVTAWAAKKNTEYSGLKHNESIKTDESKTIPQKREIKKNSLPHNLL